MRFSRHTPIANDRRKILNVIAVMVEDVIPYFKATSGRPGDMIELEKGGINVYNET